MVPQNKPNDAWLMQWGVGRWQLIAVWRWLSKNQRGEDVGVVFIWRNRHAGANLQWQWSVFFLKMERTVIKRILCRTAGIKDHSWPLFHRLRLRWDTPTSIFMTSSAVPHGGFQIRLHDTTSGKIQNHSHWDEVRMGF